MNTFLACFSACVGIVFVWLGFVLLLPKAKIALYKRPSKKERRQLLDAKRENLTNTVSCISLNRAEIKLIQTEGIERASEILGLHPALLVRSLKVQGDSLT